MFGASGQRIDVLLPQPTPGAPLPPVFDSRGPSISDGQLVTVVDRYGPGDSHASGPSIRQTVTWRWSGQHFAVTSVQ